MRHGLPTHGAFPPWRNKNKWSPDAPHLHLGRERLKPKREICLSVSAGWLIHQPNASASRAEQSKTRPVTVTARKLYDVNSSCMLHHRGGGWSNLWRLSAPDRGPGSYARIYRFFKKKSPLDSCCFHWAAPRSGWKCRSGTRSRRSRRKRR
jgi:hypothetical protein